MEEIMTMGNYSTNISVENVAKMIYFYLEYLFQGKIKEPEPKGRERLRKVFFKEISKPIAYKLFKNDWTIPIIDFEEFYEILQKKKFFSLLGIEEMSVVKEMAEEVFYTWYHDFFSDDIYKKFWQMIMSAEKIAKTEKISAIKVIKERFHI